MRNRNNNQQNEECIKTRTLSFDLNTIPINKVLLKAIVFDENNKRVDRGYVIFSSESISFEDNVKFNNGLAQICVNISNLKEGLYNFNVNFFDDTNMYCSSSDSSTLQIFKVS